MSQATKEVVCCGRVPGCGLSGHKTQHAASCRAQCQGKHARRRKSIRVRKPIGGVRVARVFITGSSDGLGLMAARLLIDQGHEVLLHGRNEGRSRDALAAAAGAKGVVSGDLSTFAGAKTVADQVNKLGRFDAVIHNAGIGYREGRGETEPGVPSVFAVHVLAPYILTALVERPGRLVYVSSGTHHGVRPRMDDLLWTRRAWSGFSAYAESKLCDVLMA